MATLRNPVFGVAGGGAWGTALACVTARSSAGQTVRLWVREPDAVASINTRRENVAFLPGIPIPRNVVADQSVASLAACSVVLVATPTRLVRRIVADLADVLPSDAEIVLCAKGVESDTKKLPFQVAEERFDPERVFVLSGPGFAADVASGLPTTVALAGVDARRGAALCRALGDDVFHLVPTTDSIGVGLGGAIKNVLAVACGFIDGRRLGAGARASLTCAGFIEMRALGAAMGAQAATFLGPSGLGDLVLTCASPESRNHSLGRSLAHGRREALAPSGPGSALVEGAASAGAVRSLAALLGIDVPICAIVADLVDGGRTIDACAHALTARLSGETSFSAENEVSPALRRPESADSA